MQPSSSERGTFKHGFHAFSHLCTRSTFAQARSRPLQSGRSPRVCRCFPQHSTSQSSKIDSIQSFYLARFQWASTHAKTRSAAALWRSRSGADPPCMRKNIPGFLCQSGRSHSQLAIQNLRRQPLQNARGFLAVGGAYGLHWLNECHAV